MMLAVIRPNGWNLPLYVHIAAAMALVASMIVALYAIRIARERGDQPAAQFAFRVLLRMSLPAFVVMRVAAQIVVNKESLDRHSPSWVGVGFGVSDIGFVVLLVGLVLTGLMARRARQGRSVAGAPQLLAAGALSGLLVVAYVVAIWAMTTKPA